MIEKFNKIKITQHLEAQLRIQLQTEGLMLTYLKEHFRGISKGERQAVISAQQLAISLQSGIKTYQGGGGAKHEENSWGEPLALLICSSTTSRTGLFATLHANRKISFTTFSESQRKEDYSTVKQNSGLILPSQKSEIYTYKSQRIY